MLPSLIHITAAYSNAVLVAVLPHVSDFAKKLDLPIPTPVTSSQITHFNVSPWKDEIGGGLWLTNHYFFGFNHGNVMSFRSPTNWFDNNYDNWNDTEYFKRYLGKDNMTTNEAVESARHSFYKLGFKSQDFDIRGSPTRFQGPIYLKNIGHIPFCRIEWDSPPSKVWNLLGLDFSIQFDVDMHRKEIAAINLSGKKFWQPNPKVDVVPELETNYQNAGLAGQAATFLNREPAVHVTPAYSNATLMATLPYVADFTKRLKLPVTQPLTNDQILLFFPPAYTNDGFKSTIVLTNHYWFLFFAGFVAEFGSPDDWFEEAGTKTNWAGFNQNCMTTNEAIEFARNSFRQLGYKPEDFHLNESPTIQTAMNGQNQRYAYCRVDWENPDVAEEETEEKQPDIYQVRFDIDMLRKQVVGATLINKKFMRPLPKISMVPELESNYQKRADAKMFIRTNAPRHYRP